MRKKTIAIILAAGSGERSGFEIPKQLVELAGKPIVEYTISSFQNSGSIDEIIVVTSNNCIAKIEEIVTNRAFTKVKKIIYGGKERHESSLAAINASKQEAEQFDIKLIFHDAVRPLVSDRIIHDVVLALDHYNAVDVVVPTTDIIIFADPVTNTIDSVPDRKKLRNVQTPQGFSWKTIKLAYHLALEDPDFKTTDDCGVVFRYLPHEKIYLVNGESNNIKVTNKEDLQIIDKLLQLKAKDVALFPSGVLADESTGHVYDVTTQPDNEQDAGLVDELKELIQGTNKGFNRSIFIEDTVVEGDLAS